MKNKLFYCRVCREHRMHQLMDEIDDRWMCKYCDNVLIPVAEKQHRDALLEQAGMTEDELAWLG